MPDDNPSADEREARFRRLLRIYREKIVPRPRRISDDVWRALDTLFDDELPPITTYQPIPPVGREAA